MGAGVQRAAALWRGILGVSPKEQKPSFLGAVGQKKGCDRLQLATTSSKAE